MIRKNNRYIIKNLLNEIEERIQTGERKKAIWCDLFNKEIIDCKYPMFARYLQNKESDIEEIIDTIKIENSKDNIEHLKSENISFKEKDEETERIEKFKAKYQQKNGFKHSAIIDNE